MPIILSSSLSLAFGLAVVAITSPTIASFCFHPTSSVLIIHALYVDATLAVLIAFIVLCRVEPSWIAKNQLFPYTLQPEWNFGSQVFSFQLLMFEIFHTAWSSRFFHSVNLIMEGFLWILLIHVTFGAWGTGITLALLSLQAISFGDPILATTIISINTLFATTSHIALSCLPYTPIQLLSLAKISLFWLSAARTLNHALEPLPPTFVPTVAILDDSFGYPTYQLFFKAPLRSIWMLALGQVSELSAGMPGRLFSQIVYKIMWKAGYRSGTLLDVGLAKRQAWQVIEGGWQAHPVTKELYAWATRGCDESVVSRLG